MSVVSSGLDLSDFGLIFYGGPLACIVTRKNHIKLRKIERMREFFINEYGVFEMDSETEYRYNKQPISFYNSHDTGIPKKLVKKLYKLYYRGKFLEMRKVLEGVFPEIEDQPFKDVYEMLRFIVIRTKHKAIDLDTEKYMPFFRAYNPISIKRLNEVCQNARKGIDSLHPSLKPPLPFVIVIAGAIIALAAMQNAPKWAREISANIESTISPPPPPPPPAPAPEPIEDPALPDPTDVLDPNLVPAEPAQFLMGVLDLPQITLGIQHFFELISFL